MVVLDFLSRKVGIPLLGLGMYSFHGPKNYTVISRGESLLTVIKNTDISQVA